MKQAPKHIRQQLATLSKAERSYNRKNTGCLRPALIIIGIMFCVAFAIYNTFIA